MSFEDDENDNDDEMMDDIIEGDEDQEETDLDLDYNASDLTDDEIDEKLQDISQSADPMEEHLAEMRAEEDYLYNEKNKRFAKKKNDGK